ncbi:MAG TPA: copper homeostasis protein CutC [Tepidisphaeraceae bacterium]|jgi:copper homeostasis protein
MNSPLIEICLESVADARTATAAGANRLELCSALALGGLTPSSGALTEVREATPLPIMTMIRPRPGGFCYSDTELAVMQRDIDFAIENGADGIVFGILTADGRIDVERSKGIIRQIEAAPRRLQIVFHRAFDYTPDPLVALDQLIELRIDRVLTSGQQATALEGAALIGDMVQRSAGRIEILPAAGINADNVCALIARTRCTQIHASMRKQVSDLSLAARTAPALQAITASQNDRHFTATSGQDVQALVNRLHNLAAQSQ